MYKTVVKVSGLDSTARNRVRKMTKNAAFGNHLDKLHAAREKQKALLEQAQRAQLERQRKERLLAEAAAAASQK